MTQRSPVVLVPGAAFGRGVATPRALAENGFEVLTPTRSWSRQYQGKPVTVPAMFIGGDRDVATIWSQQAIARAGEALTDLRGSIILRNCGHWIMQEQPDAVNKELLLFLQGLS